MLLLSLLLCLACHIHFTNAEDIATSLHPYIYTDLGTWPCVRLLNATGSIGCQSTTGTNGILYQLNTQDDIENFSQNMPTSWEQWVAVIPYGLLTPSNLQTLESSKRLSGVIAIVNSTSTPGSPSRPSSYSPESKCPNCEFGLYANDTDQYTWNPNGNSMIYEPVNIPIFALDPIDTLSAATYKQVMADLNYNIEQNYRNYPLRAVDFSLFMWAAVDSATCLRRGWCFPVGGSSVYSSPSPDLTGNDGKPIIIVSATMDSRSVFHDLTLGVENDISGMVAMLAVADALSKSPTPVASFPKHIVYTLFNGEAWGYSGSQRFVNDISSPFECKNITGTNTCPIKGAACTQPCVRDTDFTNINFDNIESVVEFSSVAQSNASAKGFWAHTDDTTTSGSLLQLFISQGNSTNSIQDAASDGVHRKLPPSSAQSFLKKKRSIASIVLSDFQTSLDGYYHSDYDDMLDLATASSAICSLASSAARSIWLSAQGLNNGTVPAQVTADCNLVTSLLDCLTQNYSCSLIQQYYGVNNAARITHYSSVFSFGGVSLLSLFAFNFLGDKNGVRRMNGTSPASCQSITDCQAHEYCIRGTCVSTLTRYHDSYGAGLGYNYGTGLFNVIDESAPTWTESTWNPPTMRVYSVTSTRHQVIELVIGVLWLVSSIIIVLYLKRYLKKTLKIA
ncbi:Nicastrin-domain-containing protein [Umbelopsis sp. AD052]|nr:Nicastrin-domain-containing protein [Umbelopsis sp. AD052]